MGHEPIVTRRSLLAAGAAALAGATLPAAAQDVDEAKYFAGLVDDNGKAYRKTRMSAIEKRWRRQLVKYPHHEPPGRSNRTVAVSAARLTDASATPSTFRRAFSTRLTHEAQVIPAMSSTRLADSTRSVADSTVMPGTIPP